MILYLAVRADKRNCLGPEAAVWLRRACFTADFTDFPISSPSLECPEASVRVLVPQRLEAITIPSVPEPVAISSE